LAAHWKLSRQAGGYGVNYVSKLIFLNMATESGMFVFTREELGWDKTEAERAPAKYFNADGTPIADKDVSKIFPQTPEHQESSPARGVLYDAEGNIVKDRARWGQDPVTLGESIAQFFTGTSQQATTSYSTTQRVQSRSSKNDEQAMEAMQSHVGGWFFGLVLGFVAYRIVRPKTKCSTPMEMARRWMSWGLMGGMTTGTTHFFRYGGAEGIAGGLLGVCFFSGAAWVLGLVWGGLRFRLFPKIVSASGSLDGEADKEIKLENLPGIREAAARGQAREQYLLGLCYYEGKGVVKNQVEAYKWMLLAQANGFEKARKLSAKMEKALSRSEVAEGQKLATQMQQG
jgi:hypothetical protein